MTVTFIWYPKCSTCQKAAKWLNEHGIEHNDRHIVEENPTAAELAEWVGPAPYTHLRAHETPEQTVSRLFLEKKNETLTYTPPRAHQTSKQLACRLLREKKQRKK